MYKWFTNNSGIKILSLLLAIGIWSWFYKAGGFGEDAYGGERRRLYNTSEMSVKNTPIKVNLIGSPPKGYFVNYKAMSLNPNKFLLVGPKRMLDRIEFIETQPIDINEFTRTVTTKISLQPIAGINLPQEEFVEVIIPIEKIEVK